MNRGSVELGFALKQIKDYDFSMNEFNDRLKLQKLVYLLQSCGVYLGYDFSWYLRGPYCSLLAHNGFSLQDIYHRIPDNIKLKDSKDKSNFTKFLKFVMNKDIGDLEIAASLHHLKEVRGDTLTDEDIIKMVIAKRKNFTEQQVNKIWKEMKKHQLIIR